MLLYKWQQSKDQQQSEKPILDQSTWHAALMYMRSTMKAHPCGPRLAARSTSITRGIEAHQPNQHSDTHRLGLVASVHSAWSPSRVGSLRVGVVCLDKRIPRQSATDSEIILFPSCAIVGTSNRPLEVHPLITCSTCNIHQSTRNTLTMWLRCNKSWYFWFIIWRRWLPFRFHYCTAYISSTQEGRKPGPLSEMIEPGICHLRQLTYIHAVSAARCWERAVHLETWWFMIREIGGRRGRGKSIFTWALYCTVHRHGPVNVPESYTVGSKWLTSPQQARGRRRSLPGADPRTASYRSLCWYRCRQRWTRLRFLPCWC